MKTLGVKKAAAVALEPTDLEPTPDILKEKGNVAYKGRDYAVAAKLYRDALAAVEITRTATTLQDTDATNLQMQRTLNGNLVRYRRAHPHRSILAVFPPGRWADYSSRWCS